MPYALHIPMRAADVSKYEPIDELLRHPRIRILRLLSRHGWLSAYEIKELLDALYDAKIANSYTTHIIRAARSGLLLMRQGVGHYSLGPDYAISDLGRRELPALLARASGVRFS